MAGVARAASLGLPTACGLGSFRKQGDAAGRRAATSKLHCQRDAFVNSPLLLPPETGKHAGLSRKEARAALKRDEGHEGASAKEGLFSALKRSAAAAALALTLASPSQSLATTLSPPPLNPVLGDVSVLISGPPIKDARTLLRNALPIQGKAVKEVQAALEGITESLRLPGTKGFDQVSGAVRKASGALNQNLDGILNEVPEAKRADASQLVDQLRAGLSDFQQVLQGSSKEAVATKQKELLSIVGNIEEAMVQRFPFEIPAEFAGKPWLKGRATVEIKLKVKDNANLSKVTMTAVVDGYNAPITAGNFVDLVERRFYDGMDIQRADGFVVQTGDPDGPSEGFVDPNTGKLRTIPLEIKVIGDKLPIYGATLEDEGRYKAQTRLPFNAFGTMAMAREEFDADSASSQIFFLLKESELTPSQANILDGRYSVFGYIVDNEDFLADLKVGDSIESMRVVQGIENLQNPSYK
ncbi:hypothetical protein KFL_000140480 [Klebsormidium nitens]|uniref:peptidylprolyl isomerase n=1 Tax=Klebsormidium nitens TaxID=105231 RepID=A0A1Y1HPL8_KLENI|nr:hypothetical protein KFL_000140480 [Klebsormidium nitens]|eukprot:GAQ78527.1 hypothetical protein KFL_000140480 [Klebsormidium nitens]